MKNTVTVDGIEYKYVYVSDISEEDALKEKEKRILLYELPWKAQHKYIVVWEYIEEQFIKWEYYETVGYKFITETPEVITIKTEDWQELEISEEKAKELWFKIK